MSVTEWAFSVWLCFCCREQASCKGLFPGRLFVSWGRGLRVWSGWKSCPTVSYLLILWQWMHGEKGQTVPHTGRQQEKRCVYSQESDERSVVWDIMTMYFLHLLWHWKLAVPCRRVEERLWMTEWRWIQLMIPQSAASYRISLFQWIRLWCTPQHQVNHKTASTTTQNTKSTL